MHTHADSSFDACLQLPYVSVWWTTSHREAVDVKGLDQVAPRDGIPQGAVPALVRVDGRHCGDSRTHCVGSLAQHGHVLLLGKLGRVVILIHDVNVDGGRGLRRQGETCTAVSHMSGCV